MNQKYYIGIDISKAKIDVSVLNSGNEIVLRKIVANHDESIATFLKTLYRKLKISSQNVLLCCETTGIYNRPLQRVCHDLGIILWVEHALKIKRASTDLRGKSDQKDADRIAQYCKRYEDKLVAYKMPSAVVTSMKAKTKIRETIIGQKVALENQLREAKSHDKCLYKELSKIYLPMIKKLKKTLDSIEKEIQQLAVNEPEIAKNVELLCSIKGIGKQNAMQFIIETNNFDNFESAKHMACYVGVAPFPNESGTISKGSRVSKMANQKLKSMIHLAAMSAARHNGELKEYYVRKVSEGKNKMSVINAVRNKLIHRMWAVIKRQTQYETNFLTTQIN